MLNNLNNLLRTASKLTVRDLLDLIQIVLPLSSKTSQLKGNNRLKMLGLGRGLVQVLGVTILWHE